MDSIEGQSSSSSTTSVQVGGLGRKLNESQQYKNPPVVLSSKTETTKLDWFDALKQQIKTFDYILAMQNQDSKNINNVILFVKMIKFLINSSSAEQEQSKKCCKDEEAQLKIQWLKEKKFLILKQVELFSLHNKENPTLSLILQVTKFIVEGRPEMSLSGGMSVLDIVQRSPLENDLILKEILKNFNTSTLLNFRLINSQWNNNALTFPFDKLKLSFQYDFISNSFIRIDNVVGAVKKCKTDTTRSSSSSSTSSLKLLNDCLANSKTSSMFPVSKYEFTFGDLNLSEAFNFFKNHGELVYELKLTLRNHHESLMTNLKKIMTTNPTKLVHLLKYQNRTPYSSTKILRKVLLDFTPNLHTLILISTPEEWEVSETMNDDNVKKTLMNQLFPEPRGEIQLKSISTIKLGQTSSKLNTQVVKDILQAAVNVKCIEEFDMTYWECYASTEAKQRIASAIKVLDLKLTKQNLTIYEDFLQYSTQFHVISIDLNEVRNEVDLYPQLTIIIQKIFDGSKNLVERIQKMRPLSFLPTLENIPKLEKVTFVDFWNFRPYKQPESPCKMLPRGLKISDVFPSLEKVSMCPFFVEHWISYFDSSEIVPTVTDLLVSVQSVNDLQRVAQVFPNVEKLILIIDSRNLLTIRMLWPAFVNLKSLGLVILKNVHMTFSRVTKILDTGITGITLKNCKELLMNSRNVTMEEVDNLRQFHWMGDASALRTMAICTFLDKDIKNLVTSVSPVTKIFGIQAAAKKNNCKIRVVHKTFVRSQNRDSTVQNGVKWVIKLLDE